MNREVNRELNLDEILFFLRKQGYLTLSFSFTTDNVDVSGADLSIHHVDGAHHTFHGRNELRAARLALAWVNWTKSEPPHIEDKSDYGYDGSEAVKEKLLKDESVRERLIKKGFIKPD